jgi:hypothetical protein
MMEGGRRIYDWGLGALGCYCLFKLDLYSGCCLISRAARGIPSVWPIFSHRDGVWVSSRSPPLSPECGPQRVIGDIL